MFGVRELTRWRFGFVWTLLLRSVLKTVFEQHLPLNHRNIVRRLVALLLHVVHELHRIKRLCGSLAYDIVERARPDPPVPIFAVGKIAFHPVHDRVPVTAHGRF